MTYGNLIQFEEIETVVQLRDTDHESTSRRIVATYVVKHGDGPRRDCARRVAGCAHQRGRGFRESVPMPRHIHPATAERMLRPPQGSVTISTSNCRIHPWLRPFAHGEIKMTHRNLNTVRPDRYDRSVERYRS